MARTLRRKPAKAGRKRSLPARKKPVAAVEITNAQLAAELRGVAKRLGISFAALSGLLVAHLRGKRLLEPDEGVSLQEFDQACRAKREARLRKREAEEAANRRREVGTDADEIGSRGAVLNSKTMETYIDHRGNPDELVEGAVQLLLRRLPENWHANVLGAWAQIGEAAKMALDRHIVTRKDYRQARAALKAFRPPGEAR